MSGEANTTQYVVTFEAEYRIELDDEPDDAEFSRTRQELQNELGHSGIIVGEVISVD